MRLRIRIRIAPRDRPLLDLPTSCQMVEGCNEGLGQRMIVWFILCPFWYLTALLNSGFY